MIRSISILGSTGSIGTQALDIARHLGIKVQALAAHSNIKLLEQQIREFKPKFVAVYDYDSAVKLRESVKDLSVNVLDGIEGICEIASIEQTDLVLNAVVGMVGIRPTIAAIKTKKNVALANKETLVAGGELVMRAAEENGVRIIPVDSEHSAIFQCMQGCPDRSYIKRLILTASGGPFFGRTKNQLDNVTLEQALNHPNWSMGTKITIDSATMMNKGLEVIEAVWLFGIPCEDIDVIIHRESIVHSLIEYNDNSVLAQLGVADMRIPIQYAITFPERRISPVKQLNLTEISSLSFYKPDYDTFICLNACKMAISLGGLVPAAVNGANEEAVKLFLENKIKFNDIGFLVNSVVKRQEPGEIKDFEDILNADRLARDYVLGCCK